MNLGWCIGTNLSLFFMLVAVVSTVMALSEIMRPAHEDGYKNYNVEERLWLDDERIYCSKYFEPTRGFFCGVYLCAFHMVRPVYQYYFLRSWLCKQH